MDDPSPSPALFLSSAHTAAVSAPSVPASNPHLRLRRSVRDHFPPAAPHLSPTRPVRSLPQLQRVLLQTRARSSTIHLRHPTRPSASHVVLDLSPLNAVSLHATRQFVVAQAGVTVQYLYQFCAQHGLMPGAMIRAPDAKTTVSDVLYSGAPAFCTEDGLFADCVEQMSIVDAHGRLRVFSSADAMALFRCAKTSLGLFGVIYDVTLRVKPVTCVRVSSRYVPFGEVTALLGAHVACELVWHPFNSYKPSCSWSAASDVAQIRILDTSSSTSCNSNVPVSKQTTVPQWILSQAKHLVDGNYTTFNPSHTPLLLSLQFSEAYNKETNSYTTSLPNAVNNFHLPACEVFSTFTVSIPLEDDEHLLQTAWKIVAKHVEAAHARGVYPMNGPMRMQLSRSSDAHLAATNSRRPLCALLSICSACNTVGWAKFATAVLEELLQLAGARPVMTDELTGLISRQTLQSVLGESLRIFRNIHANSAVDDYGMFHSHTAELLEIARTPAAELCTSPVSSMGEPARERHSSLNVVRAVPRSSLEALLARDAAFGSDLYYYDDDSDLDMPLVDVGMMRAHHREISPMLYVSPLTQSEISLLYAYVFLYLVLWVFMFGADVLRSFGWVI